MSIEHEILYLAYMASNACGWQSEVAGYVTAQTEDKYVQAVQEFASNLKLDDYSEDVYDENYSDYYQVIKAFIDRVNAGYSTAVLEKLTREDWQEQEEKKREYS